MKRKLCVDVGACVPKIGPHDDAAMRSFGWYESNDPAPQRAWSGWFRSVVATVLFGAVADANAAEPRLMSGGIYTTGATQHPNPALGPGVPKETRA